jgi:signal transduction histidine kinase
LRNVVVLAAAVAFSVIALSGLMGYRNILVVITNFQDLRRDSDTIAALDRGDLQRVAALTANEPQQRRRLQILRATTGAGSAERVRAIDEMRDEEERQRRVSRVNADTSGRRALQGVVVSTTVSALLLLLTFAQVAATARANRIARERAEDANRMKDEFIATVSHELRTPLATILGWSSILGDDSIDREILREGLATIQRSASVQKKLIEDLLDVSRTLTGKLRLSMRTLDLQEVVHSAVESMRPAADAKSISLLTSFEPSIRVSGDPDRLQQIIWNLMTNSVKFTPRGGIISVVTSSAGEHALIEVRDSGEGIDASFLPHVFERFRQSDASRAREHKGLGLGLSIVKYLAEAHGGTVSAWSDGIGTGTTFRVMLPIVAMPAPLPAIATR